MARKSILREANIRTDSEKECVTFLKNIKAEGGRVYYHKEARRLVINPRRKSYRFIAGLQTSPSMADTITRKLKIENKADWLRRKKQFSI
jgi:hypothetical protein